MLDDLAVQGAALTLAVTLVFAAGAVGVLRTWHSPDQCAGLCIVLLVLTLTMAASVVMFRPLQAGDLVEAQKQHGPDCSAAMFSCRRGPP
jgi:CHASE2 domain-containing sensor protein